MEPNLLVVAALCAALSTRWGAWQPKRVAALVHRLCEINAQLYTLSPTGKREARGQWKFEEEHLYAEAQKLVMLFTKKSGVPLELFYNAEIPASHPGSRLRLQIPRSMFDHRNPLYLQAEPLSVEGAQ